MSAFHYGKHYRYYVSQAIIQSEKQNAGSLDKIPSGEIENLVKTEIKNFLQKEDNIQKYLNDTNIHEQKDLHKKLKEIELSNVQIRSVLSRVILSKNSLEILFCENGVVKFLESLICSKEFLKEAAADSDEIISIKKDIQISRTSRKGSVLIVNGEKKTRNVDPILVNAIVKSYRWNKMLKTGEIEQIKDIAKFESEHCVDYIKRVVRLNILSPRIVESILNGTQPPDFNLQKLYKLRTLDWKVQEKSLNFV